MTESDSRAPRSAVMGSAKSRSFVTFGADKERVGTKPSCTPERLRP